MNDAPAIGMVHVRSWQAIYAGHFPQEYLDGLDATQRADYWRSYLGPGRDGPDATIVVERLGEVVGFANVGASRDEGAASSEGEVRAIYLQPGDWGTGLGRQLMAAAIDHLREARFSEAILWVLDGNDRARRFYENGGWKADGATKQDDSFGFPISEVRYRRRL